MADPIEDEQGNRFTFKYDKAGMPRVTIRDNDFHFSAAGNVSSPAHNPSMTDSVPRHELDAKLDALRHEVRADNEALRKDFASLRADIASLSGDVKGSVGRIEGVVEGMKSSLTTHQWVVTTLLAVGALLLAFTQFSREPSATTTAAPAPVILNFTGVAPTAPAPTPTTPPPTPAK